MGEEVDFPAVLLVGPPTAAQRSLIEAIQVEFDVSEAQSFEEAQQLLADRPIDLCLASIDNVPPMIEEVEGIPVIGWAERIDVDCQPLFDVGVVDVLLFPLEGTVLLPRLWNLLSLYQELEDLRDANTELLRRSESDPLTGLHNRSALCRYGCQAIAKAQRTGNPLSMLIVDIDHFKKVNDRCGHAAGDSVLCATAHLIQGRLRKYDLMARFGGDEFVVILPHTERIGAQRVAEKIVGLVHEESAGSVSIGVTTYFPTEKDDGDEQSILNKLIHRADRALYSAKQEGRNRACVSEEVDE